MGGSSGIALVDNINPFHRDENQMGTVGNFVGSFTDGVRDNQRPIAAFGAFALGMGALGSSLGGASAAEAATANTGYLGFTSAEAGSTGAGYLGANTTLSGSGMAAAELGGAGASSAAAVNYSAGYLGAEIGGSAYGSAAGSSLGYLGADVGSVASSNSGLGYLGVNTQLASGAAETASWTSYIPSAKDALSYASAIGLLRGGNPQAAADALKGSPLGGYLPNINIETPNAPDWLSGITGLFGGGNQVSPGTHNQSGAASSYPQQSSSLVNTKTAAVLLVALAAVYLAKKKRMI